jgi:hypothetical protein
MTKFPEKLQNGHSDMNVYLGNNNNNELPAILEWFDNSGHTSRELWFFQLQSVEAIYSNFNNLSSLRLDGDIFCLVQQDESAILIYEVYKLGRELEVLPFANWHPTNGLTLPKLSKWERRSNLKVVCWKT